MGYTYRNNNQIEDYWPDDTADTIHLDTSCFSYTISELIEKAKEKWPDATLEDISIHSSFIHTSCLGYDQFDRSDYTEFLIIKFVKRTD